MCLYVVWVSIYVCYIVISLVLAGTRAFSENAQTDDSHHNIMLMDYFKRCLKCVGLPAILRNF